MDTTTKSVIFNAARDGKIGRLKLFLENKTKDDICKLIHSKTNGATPLIMSCRNGHFDVVKYLIENCDVDCEQPGSVTFDGETIEGAPPLWCAAAAGHLPIVQYLIEKASDVNKTTLTNSTPLRAACFDGHLNIVKYLVTQRADPEIANRHGHTCLMISCYKGHYDIAEYLLKLGVKFNRKSVKGNTALHDCAESGSLEIMKLLLRYGATMERDSYGTTPILAASVAGWANVVDFLIKTDYHTKLEKIEALELLGATYVDKKKDMSGALSYWRLAMSERFSNTSHVLPKPPELSVIAAYENLAEACSLDELEEMINEPDDIRMQALLVRERILGPTHPDTTYYIRYRGALYADMGNFDRCIVLWMYALDMQQKVLEPLNPMTQSSFLSFAELFSFMTNDTRKMSNVRLEFCDIKIVLVKAIDELHRGRDRLLNTDLAERDFTYFNRLLTIIMHLICLICRLRKDMTSEEEEELKECAYRLVHMNPRGNKGYTPLHLACSRETTNVGRYPVCSFPSVEIIQLLLEVNANIDAVDLDGSTPLHTAASNRPCRYEVLRALLDSNAHLDICNNERKTALEMVRGNLILEAISPLKHLSLQCLAACSIVKNELHYKGTVPKSLEPFIEMH